MTTKKKSQASIVTFTVETPRYAVVHRPSPPTKRPLAVKRGPGRPRKIRRQEEDWTQVWYDAVESERSSLLRVCESYEAAYVSYYADKASRTPVRPTKFQATS